MKKERWGIGERIGAWTLVIAVIAIIASFFVPEVRRFLHLDKQQTESEIKPSSAAAETTPITQNPEPPKPELHDADQSGIRYQVAWSVDANCTGWQRQVAAHPELVGGHSCEFTHTGAKIGQSNDAFDHWNIAVEAPGDVYDVDCQKNGHELFEDGTDGANNRHKGAPQGRWGRCTGWINGGDDPVTVTAYYRVLR